MSAFQRSVYLKTTDLATAKMILKTKILQNSRPLKTKRISVLESLHSVSAEAVFAKLSNPFYNSSAMDGIAVIASHTRLADVSHPIELTVDTDFIYVNTGDPIEAPYDSVIMIEDLLEREKNRVVIKEACPPYQHIRPIGEDIVEKDMILSINHRIRPVDIAAMVAGGVKDICVYIAPKVAVIPTGDEIITQPDTMEKGKIIDSNSAFLIHSVTECGGEPSSYPPTKDVYEDIKERLLEALKDHDVVLIVAGSSAGSKDYTSSIIEECGEVFVHGVAIKPGKPVILGLIDGKPVIGIPGFPVSTYLAFDEFVKPLLLGMVHQIPPLRPVVQATLTKKLVSSLNHLEYVRVKLGYVNNQLIATPLSRGAGVTMSLVNADGFLLIDKNSEGFEANSRVDIELLKDIEEIKHALVSIGSHDLVLDLVATLLKEMNRPTNLSSSHVGSFGGVMSIKRGECVLAPIHLLDEETGVYNEPILKKYFGQEVVLIKGIKREQGLMKRKDNPKKIDSILDLTQQDVSFINRQNGSGTRILLDHLLKQQEISPQLIAGYTFEVSTHMMVASAIHSGTRDCGLGVRSAAQIFDLDFIPVGYEDYDFLVLKNALHSQEVEDFLAVLLSQPFKERVLSMGGYLFAETGRVIENE